MIRLLPFCFGYIACEEKNFFLSPSGSGTGSIVQNFQALVKFPSLGYIACEEKQNILSPWFWYKIYRLKFSSLASEF